MRPETPPLSDISPDSVIRHCGAQVAQRNKVNVYSESVTDKDAIDHLLIVEKLHHRHSKIVKECVGITIFNGIVLLWLTF